MASGRTQLRVTNWSLRRKLVAVLIAASLVPFAIAAVLDLRASRARLRAAAADLLAANADQLRGRVDAFHRGYLQAAGKLAHAPSITQVLLGTAALAELAVVRQVIEVQVDSDHDLSGMAIVDRHGRVLVSRPSLTGTYLAERSYTPAAPWISDLFVDPVLSNPSMPAHVTPTIAYTAPVSVPGRGPGSSDELLGFVVMWIDGTALWDLTRGANELAGAGSFAVLLDRDGIRIAHSSDDDLVYRPLAPLPAARRAELVAQQRFAGATARYLDDVRPFPQLYEHVRTEPPDPAMFRGIAAVNHEWNYVVTRRLNKLPWTVACMLPVRTLDERLAGLTEHKLILAGFIMVAAFALGLWLSSLLLRPVTALSAATERIAGGDLSTRVAMPGGEPDSPTDELGQLCDRFNMMAERIERDDAALRRSRDELEDRVADRTGELVRAAVTEARAREALEASAKRLEVLSRTAHELAAVSGDADAVLELAARRLGEEIGEACTIRLRSDDGAWLEPTTILHHPDPDPAIRARTLKALGGTRVPVGAGVAGRVAGTGEAVLLPVVTADAVPAGVPPVLVAMLAQVGVASLLAVPLRSRERTTGVVILVRTAASPAFTVDDQRFAQDVADRAGLALDNAVLVQTLERRVAARTAALETANHELEAFSYSVSHDLRAPLRTIDGFSDILMSDYSAQLDAEAQRYLQRIRVATQRMSGLIDDLLNLARITRVQLRWSPIDVSAIAGQIVAELARRDPERTTAVHIAPGLTGQGDARLVTIALENLLGNAWKFTAKDPAAEIWLGEHQDAEHAVLFVRDTGAGFDMKYADKLFLPFHRLHSAEEFEGVGVGLATVQRIIAHHGGRIWAEAAVGEGATFFFYLGDPA